MAKQAEQKEISKGICGFCQSEVAKNKMTQHLKSCKARLAGAADQEGQKQRLFHLFVEGTYRPSYWMHLEVPAAATLLDLDDFLRATWLECCGHLSEFSIGDTSYASSVEDGDFGGLFEEEEEGEDQNLPGVEVMTTQISDNLSAELHADLKDVPLAQIEEKLVEMLSGKLPPGLPSPASPEFRPFLSYMASALQQGTLAGEIESLEEMEDGEDDMEVELGEILRVGEKFSYVYDFGSSTNLSFRVMAEREGAVPSSLTDEPVVEEPEEEGEEIAIAVMARNEPPALRCHICGQPATHVLPESEYNYLDEAGLCNACAQKRDYPDELLPVVNSPRVGVCGYTGEYDEAEDWDEEGE